ncbi:expressed unknown protein [Seminavis robusta]|uniref:Post-SET domain-containing protein n=1 Tax=Seminavis robusta TaxID=568900 RepID=A0A9N8DQW8_9STRA|nr:expressed unknown protein [Seminavis robusta]|eukprot:Sro217_g089910.1 n/a (609) ;mRNA; r:82200-84026
MDETTQKSSKKNSLVSLSHQRFLASFLLPPKNQQQQQQQPQPTEWKHPLLRSSQEHEESRRQRYRQQRQEKISIQQQLLEEKLQRLRSKRISLAAEIAQVGSKLDANNNQKRSSDPSNPLANNNDDTTIRRSSNFVQSLQKVRNKRKLTAAARLGGITTGIPVDDPEVLSIRFDICVDGAYVASYHVFFHLILLVDPSMATSNEKKEHGNITKAETTTTQTKKTGQEERRDGEFEEQNDSDSSDQETTKQSPPTEGNARKKPKLTTHAGTHRKGDSEKESDSDNDDDDDDDSDCSEEENPKQPSSRETKHRKSYNIRKKRRLKPIQLKKASRKQDSDSDYQDESERPKPKSRAKAKRTSRRKREIDESDSKYRDESKEETPQQETTTHENKNLPQLCLRLTQHTIPSAIPLADIAMATLGGTLFGLGDFDGGEWTSNAGVMKMLQERLGRFGRQCYRACSAWEQRKHSWELLMQKGQQQQPCRCDADDCRGHVKVASVTTPASNALHQVSFQLSKTWCKQGDTSVSSSCCYNVALLYDDWLRGIPSHVQVDRSSPPTATIPPRQNGPPERDDHVLDAIRQAFLECPVERALSRLEQQWEQGNARQRSN